MIAAKLDKAARLRQGLRTWQQLNPSGSRRRSEAREALALIQWLIWEEMRLESRRCAYVDKDGDLCAADLRLLARQLSERSKEWGGGQYSYWRALRILREFERCGYIKRSSQHRYQVDGKWRSSTRYVTFTKAFFVELGGLALWAAVTEAGQKKVTDLSTRVKTAGGNVAASLAALFLYTRVFSPWQRKCKPAQPSPKPPPSMA